MKFKYCKFVFLAFQSYRKPRRYTSLETRCEESLTYSELFPINETFGAKNNYYTKKEVLGYNTRDYSGAAILFILRSSSFNIQILFRLSDVVHIILIII